jgi:hypothetical protein
LENSRKLHCTGTCAQHMGQGAQIPGTIMPRSSLLFLGTCVSCCLAWSSYKSKIPNGSMGGVGHSVCTSPSSCGGGGSRNSFGSAFASAGKAWTKAFCEADSDGDGKSNGLELGDPCCVWTDGAAPQFTTDLSAPGSSSSTTTRDMPDCGGSSSGGDGGDNSGDSGGGSEFGHACMQRIDLYSLVPSWTRTHAP